VFWYQSHKLLYRGVGLAHDSFGNKVGFLWRAIRRVIRHIGVNTVKNVNKFGLFLEGIYAKSIEIFTIYVTGK